MEVWDAWSFFKLLDEDAGGAVEIEEFLQGCLRLRGQARATDVVRLVHDQTWLIREHGKLATYVEAAPAAHTIRYTQTLIIIHHNITYKRRVRRHNT